MGPEVDNGPNADFIWLKICKGTPVSRGKCEYSEQRKNGSPELELVGTITMMLIPTL
jgi:hypothetical protein